MSLDAAIALTVVGSCLCALSWIFQKRAAVALPTITGDLPVATLIAFATSGRWLAGVALMASGFALFQLAVASTGRIAVLQPMFSVGGVLLAILAVTLLHERFRAAEWVALGVILAAATVLGVTVEPQAGRPSALGVGIAAAVGGAAVLLMLAGGGRLSRRYSLEFLLGVGGGVVQGVGLVLMGAHATLSASGAGVWSALLVPAALACFAMSFISMQRGVQEGRAMIVVTLNTVTTNVMAIAGGLLVLGERLPSDELRAALLIVSVAAIVAASGVLARFGASPAAA
jgi:drug/metabolite transporter (DMT)-like permease